MTFDFDDPRMARKKRGVIRERVYTLPEIDKLAKMVHRHHPQTDSAGRTITWMGCQEEICVAWQQKFDETPAAHEEPWEKGRS